MTQYLFGLIGYPISHSFSKQYFSEKFEKNNLKNYNYELFALQNIEHIYSLLQDNPNLKGLNVTIPHKINIMKYLNDLDISAINAGAVNVIKIIKQEDNCLFLKGYNSDVHGFRESIKPLLKPWHNQALILGNGGATKAVSVALKELGIKYQIVSRQNSLDTISYADISAETIINNKLIINCTPLGTYPNIDTFPDIPYNHITSKHLLFDLVYNPKESLFLQKGKLYGAETKNGYEMLILQAEKAWDIWTNEQL